MIRRKKGFTLVELVVVIMILGVLAAVAAPKLLNTSGVATDNGLKQTLSIVRDAVELYSADNGGQLPPCSGDGDNFRTALKDYIRGTFPESPVGTKDFDVKAVTGANTNADDATGWMFNTDDGTFICNCTATSNDGATAYEEF
jgi:general secretion pathway protein G